MGTIAGGEGAFSSSKGWNAASVSCNGGSYQSDKFAFKASSNWSGTSQSIGSNTAFDILPPYSAAYCFRRVL